METKLSIMERTLRILVKGSQDGVRGFGRKDVVDLVKEEEVEGVWQMERTNTWYVTFASTRPPNDFDGQEVRVTDHRVILELCAFDRIIVEMKVHWLPFWVSNDTVGECFDRFEDIKITRSLRGRAIKDTFHILPPWTVTGLLSPQLADPHLF